MQCGPTPPPPLQVQSQKWNEDYCDRTETTHMSHMYIAGHRTIISYTSQLATCYICNATDHISQHCPQRIMKYPPPPPNTSLTWSQLFVMSANGHQTGTSQAPGRKTTESTDNASESTDTASNQPQQNFRRLWSNTRSSHKAPEAHLLERRNRWLRKVLSAIEAGVGVRPESAWTCLAHLTLPKWDIFIQ
jgi:hypothetical protein